jgi:hypothetical protein
MKKTEAKIIAKAIICLIPDDNFPKTFGRGGRGKMSEAKRRLKQKLVRVLTTEVLDNSSEDQKKSQPKIDLNQDQDNSWRVW